MKILLEYVGCATSVLGAVGLPYAVLEAWPATLVAITGIGAVCLYFHPPGKETATGQPAAVFRPYRWALFAACMGTAVFLFGAHVLWKKMPYFIEWEYQAKMGAHENTLGRASLKLQLSEDVHARASADEMRVYVGGVDDRATSMTALQVDRFFRRSDGPLADATHISAALCFLIVVIMVLVYITGSMFSGMAKGLHE